MKLKVYPASSFNEHLKAAQKIMFCTRIFVFYKQPSPKSSNVKRLNDRHFQLYFQRKKTCVIYYILYVQQIFYLVF